MLLTAVYSGGGLFCTILDLWKNKITHPYCEFGIQIAEFQILDIKFAKPKKMKAITSEFYSIINREFIHAGYFAQI